MKGSIIGFGLILVFFSFSFLFFLYDFGVGGSTYVCILTKLLYNYGYTFISRTKYNTLLRGGGKKKK